MKNSLILVFIVLLGCAGSTEPEFKTNSTFYRKGSLFIIENNDTFNYNKVVVTVNDKWEYTFDWVSAGKKNAVFIEEMTDEDGVRMPENIVAKEVTLDITAGEKYEFKILNKVN